MQRLSGAAPVPEPLRGGVIALGNFDGFHGGHQAVVGWAIDRARAEGRPAIVATFDPHPARFFRPDLPPFALTTIDQRGTLFEAAGADAMLVIPFNAVLAALSPADFIAMLTDRFGASAVVTGQDFTFGKNRSGDTGLLGVQPGLSAEVVRAVNDADGVISSTRIRQALAAGDCATATALLTRPFAIEGVVVDGDKLGRTIGYPTANLHLGDYQRPRYGIYAVRGRLADGRVLDGAASLGIRPTFDPPRELLEPFFLDFSGDLYGQTIAVELIAFLRPEAKFDNLDALTTQMEKDCAEARRILNP